MTKTIDNPGKYLVKDGSYYRLDEQAFATDLAKELGGIYVKDGHQHTVQIAKEDTILFFGTTWNEPIKVRVSAVPLKLKLARTHWPYYFVPNSVEPEKREKFSLDDAKVSTNIALSKIAKDVQRRVINANKAKFEALYVAEAEYNAQRNEMSARMTEFADKTGFTATPESDGTYAATFRHGKLYRNGVVYLERLSMTIDQYVELRKILGNKHD